MECHKSGISGAPKRILTLFQGQAGGSAMDKLTLPRGLKPKVQLPDQDSTKLTCRRIGCWTGAGREGAFFFVGEEDAVGADIRRLGSRMGQG